MYSVSCSELGTMLGISPYKSKLELWLEKHGDLPRLDSDSEAAYWGMVLEAPIAKRYIEATGRRVQRHNAMLEHKILPLTGHIDRRVIGEKRGVEIKTVSLRVANHWGKDADQIAEYYLPQVHGYLMLLDYPVFDVAALVGGNEFRIYTVERDKEMDDILNDSVAEFIRSLETDDQPEPSYTHATTPDLLKRLYPGTNGQVIDLPEEIQYWHEVIIDAQAEIKTYNAAIRSAKSRIQETMGEASIGRFKGGSGYTRKRIERKGYMVPDTEYIDLRFRRKIQED